MVSGEVKWVQLIQVKQEGKQEVKQEVVQDEEAVPWVPGQARGHTFLTRNWNVLRKACKSTKGN